MKRVVLLVPDRATTKSSRLYNASDVALVDRHSNCWNGWFPWPRRRPYFSELDIEAWPKYFQHSLCVTDHLASNGYRQHPVGRFRTRPTRSNCATEIVVMVFTKSTLPGVMQPPACPISKVVQFVPCRGPFCPKSGSNHRHPIPVWLNLFPCRLNLV